MVGLDFNGLVEENNLPKALELRNSLLSSPIDKLGCAGSVLVEVLEEFVEGEIKEVSPNVLI